MKKFGMGTLVFVTAVGLSLATLGGCGESKPAAKKTETKAPESEKK